MKRNNHKSTTANYYDFQKMQDKLYSDSLNGKIFKHLIDIISSRENIKLAYRNIKQNKGSHTSGIDKQNIENLAKLSENDYVETIRRKFSNYHPKAVRRVEIPKPNGKLRPLGIPCISDRIVQQCILQVLEPICEAKFYDKSYGFRPNRSTENAIAEVYRLMQRSHLHYVVDVDIKGFFDNVNHRKLIRQLWTLGIQDTKLLQIIKQMLKAPIKLPNGDMQYPKKGTPQGGILSPLLANVVLNELDWWVASQWVLFPNELKNPPKVQYSQKGCRNMGHEYNIMRKTNLKEMYIVRYADDFKIFCKTKSDAIKIKTAVIDWLSYRLKLEVSKDKTGITNLKRRYSEFLGFKIKLQTKSNKEVVNARMCDKVVQRTTDKLISQIKLIQHPEDKAKLYQRINVYNSMVMGIQNYYQIANNVCKDFNKVQFAVNRVIRNRLTVTKKGEVQNMILRKRYGNSAQMRWVNGIPIVPIGYCKSKNPMSKKAIVNQYTPEGRKELFKPPDVDFGVMYYLMQNPIQNRSIEYNDNRISLYCAQYGKCAITGKKLEIGYIHCHHKLPKNMGGTDKYQNLILVSDEVHRLIHSTKFETVSAYLSKLKLGKEQISKLNKLRVMAGLETIKQ